jgi:hypothetical protein
MSGPLPPLTREVPLPMSQTLPWSLLTSPTYEPLPISPGPVVLCICGCLVVAEHQERHTDWHKQLAAALDAIGPSETGPITTL